MGRKHNKGAKGDSQLPQARDEIASSKIKADFEIDGRTLEGGGQLLRIALCLSALTSKSIHIKNIRGNRSGPRGLKNQHLACVETLAQLCNACVLGGYVGSSELIFAPGLGEKQFPEFIGEHTIEGESFEVNKIEVDLKTPGAITLVMQAVLPYLLFRKSERPTVLSFLGGTHTSSSPSVDYLHEVFLSNLADFGLPQQCIARFENVPYMRTRSNAPLGRMSYLIRPVSKPFPLQPPKLSASLRTSTGLMAKPTIDMYLLFGTSTERDALLAEVVDNLKAELDKHEATQCLYVNARAYVAGSPAPESYTSPSSHKVENSSPKQLRAGNYSVYTLLVLYYEGGVRIGADSTHTLKYQPARRSVESPLRQKCAEVASTVVSGLRMEIEHCQRWKTELDSHMRDQILVFLGLMGGRIAEERSDKGSHSEENGLTSHAQTAVWMIELMLGVEFDTDCAGVREGWLFKQTRGEGNDVGPEETALHEQLNAVRLNEDPLL